MLSADWILKRIEKRKQRRVIEQETSVSITVTVPDKPTIKPFEKENKNGKTNV